MALGLFDATIRAEDKPVQVTATAVSADRLFAPNNLVAWCIVPFDAKKRGPEERAAMLARLGFRKFAYDYRAEHIPTFEAELAALKKHQIELTAWWFPADMNDEARKILAVLQKHGVKDPTLGYWRRCPNKIGRGTTSACVG